MYVFGPATLEIRGIHYVCCDKPQHYGATGDTSGISVTSRKMGLPIDFLSIAGNVH